MEKILKRKIVYKGKVASIAEFEIDFGNGKKDVFEMVSFNVETGVSALAMDEKENVMLVRHFQLGAGERMLTLPTGGLEKGDGPEERMQQELQEEIGYKAGKLTLMLRAHAIPGYVGTKPFYVYLAQGLKKSKIPGDEVEEIEVVKKPFDRLMSEIKEGKIMDNRIILACLYYDKFFR